MNKIAPFLLLLLLFLQPVRKLAILIDFELNQDYISKNLCVQKAVVANSCQGKCHLSKKLEQADQNQTNKIPESLQDKHETIYFYEAICSFITHSFRPLQKSAANYCYLLGFNTFKITGIFRPPKQFVISFL